MNHSFDVDLATEYGITEAILLSNLEFWIKKNEANGTNFHDGYYWTFNSTKAFGELFPYLTVRKIQNALNHLREAGILQVGNYNTSKYDRTLWYAFTEKGKSILQKREMEIPEKENPNNEKGKPIPDIKADIKPDINSDNTTEADFEELWRMYPRKDGKKAAFNAFKRALRNGTTTYIIKQGISRYLAYIRQNNISPRYIKMGSTWFNGECWNDDYDIKVTCNNGYNNGITNDLDEVFGGG